MTAPTKQNRSTATSVGKFGHQAKQPKAVWTRAFPEQVKNLQRAGGKTLKRQGLIRRVNQESAPAGSGLVRRARPKSLNKNTAHSNGSKHKSARKRDLNRYRRRVKVWIKEQQSPRRVCPVIYQLFDCMRSVTECHHLRGRAGKLLLDERFWLSVSREGHRWIHDYPERARENGWLCAKGDWGKQP